MKLYIVTRKDIPPGLMMAQAVHACRAFVEKHSDLDKQWYESSNNLACLEVGTAEELLELVRKAVCLDVPYAEFREPDLDGEVTSVSFGAAGKRILSNLPLALKADKAA